MAERATAVRGAAADCAGLDEALDELRAHPSPSVGHAMLRFAGLRYDRAYAESLFARVRDQFGGREVPFRWSPAERTPLARIGWSNQHGFSRGVLIDRLTEPELLRSPIHVLRDADRLVVWDGSHRYAGHRLRGESEIACRIVELGAYRKGGEGVVARAEREGGQSR